MAKAWNEGITKAVHIAWKDAKVYYLKAPNFTYGLLIPASLFLAFSMAGQINSSLIVSGLTAIVILFGTTSIEAVAVVLEKQTGTFERLIVAPVSFFTIALGKTLGGFFFGFLLAALVLFPLAALSGTAIASPLLALVAIALSSLTFSAMGILVSAYAKWVPEAQMLSNFLRFPMVFLSGTFILLESTPFPLQVVARFLPLTYSVEALRIAANGTMNVLVFLIDTAALALFTLAFLLISTKILEHRMK